jgi:Protein of unknown function (DUF3551)
MTKLIPLAATAALALLVQVAVPAHASAAAATGATHYCLNYNEGGTDCSFVSLAQCNATADGIGAECSVDYADQPKRMPQPHAFR